MTKIDHWDYKIIHLFKNGGFDLETLLDKTKDIWAERGAIEKEFVRISYVNQYFVELAQKLNLIYHFSGFIESLKTKHNWKYNCPYEETDFDKIEFSRIQSLFACANVADLPGYEDSPE